MKVLNSSILKNLFILIVIFIFAFGCEKKSSDFKKLQPSLKNKVGKADTAFIPNKKDYTSDTLVQEHLVVDSITIDSSANHLQETARKLDMRYFKKSFTLHKKTYITFLSPKVMDPKSNSDQEGII